MSKTLVIIPTYEEWENVRPLSESILQKLNDCDLLFVDDSSPDVTGEVIDGLALQIPAIKVIHRSTREGPGRAYVDGLKWALAREYERIILMAADFSHTPATLPLFLEATQNADLVLGSRFINGRGTANWPLWRVLSSKALARYVRLITGMPVSDPFYGFKCFSCRALESIKLDSIVSSGYSFHLELTYHMWMEGFRIQEIPIELEGQSAEGFRMSIAMLREAIRITWKLAFHNRFRRRPAAASREESQ